MTPEAGLSQPRSKIASSAFGRRCECRLKPARLAGENERRVAGETLLNHRERIGVGAGGVRVDRASSPG